MPDPTPPRDPRGRTPIDPEGARSSRVALRLPPDLLARIDEACGREPRNSWIVRVLREALA